MSERNFYSGDEIEPLYPEIIPIYQKAFKGEPWNSAAKCADIQVPPRCNDSYSPLEVGQTCPDCNQCLLKPAFEYGTLVDTFENLAATRPTSWYIERSQGDMALAMLGWKALGNTVALEKYRKVPPMQSWVQDNLGNEEIGWIDEVFADNDVKATGNLDNFVGACEKMAAKLAVDRLFFRTIQPKMLSAAKRFGQRTQILEPETEIPDWRNLVIINLEK